ncbi:lanthionine synthetase C family protein [Kitasatospora sp. NBC_01266]|uniref:lanthionine synthetase C family protein n=1 Tax=Kitasatospora sp. NBC_01266 TaxID=2903572 RepID=UPI002E350A74|nr:lanthionine synthetase C family protein [Kitasatospora sp. NBC_01266]
MRTTAELPSTPGLDPLRERAAAAVARTAELLADPTRPTVRPAAGAAALGSGAAGTALLFAELAHTEPLHRQAAHAWLTEAAAHAKADRTARPGLYQGAPALSFAMHRVALGTDDHRVARDRLGGQLGLLAERLAAAELGRAELGEECADLEAYDLFSGLAGLGAHLLDRHEAGESVPLEPVLTALVALTRPLTRHGLPGWWVAQDVRGYVPTAPRAGHASLGLAHGAPGPLALLALAWRAGVQVPGQGDAIARLADWLLVRRWEDAAGPWWPEYVELDGPLAVHAPRPAWCHGTPGIARALHLAGLALGCARWRTTAISALRAALTRPGPRGRLTDAGLCHGWAGLLQTTWRMAQESGSPELADQVPRLAERLLELHDPEEPFGFIPAARCGARTDDPAGFLTGGVGAALALHTVATGVAPATGWDRALLLA